MRTHMRTLKRVVLGRVALGRTAKTGTLEHATLGRTSTLERTATRERTASIAIWICAALLLTFAVCSVLPKSAHAFDLPDTTRTGSISGNMTYEDSPVGGGSLEVYRVGDVTVSNEGYVFTLTEEFAASEESLDDPSSSLLAESLASYAAEAGLDSTTVSIGSDGTWEISDLELGLYLIVQNDPADGYEAISPFLVSLPYYDEDADEYLYEVDADPKMEPITETPEDPVEVVDEKLPQTGQLNWPVPILAILGVVMFIVGYGVLHGGKEKDDAS